jgi:NADPH-dependent curcumin reductase CurA
LHPIQVREGDVMLGPAVVEIVESQRPDLQVGDLVRGMFGWQDFVHIARGAPVRKLDPAVPVPLALSVLIGNGQTAYFGMLEIGRARPGKTVVVSAAAGATGSVAAQVARIARCRVIGIAGSADKCAWLVDTCHLDAAVNYRQEDVASRLRELCPDGIDIFFDAVGGAILDAAINNMADHGRIVLCGEMASYDSEEPPPGPRSLFPLVARGVTMKGFLLSQFADRLGEAYDNLLRWVQGGELCYRADIEHGLEHAPRAFLRLYSGANRGKQLLEV